MYEWHAQLWQQLALTHQQHRFHHAQLLVGLVGVGKRELAQDIAYGLLCDANETLNACGRCKSCALIQAQTHPDLMQISAQSQSISVESIRELASFVHHSAQQGGKKVAIITNAQKMTHSAANALLKTLEEPNDGRYILLTCDDTEQLPATILSRCSHVPVRVLQQSQSWDWLVGQNINIDQYPWVKHFLSQPLIVMKWHEDQLLDKVDALHKFACNVKEGDNFTQVQATLAETPELMSVFCLFIQMQLKDRLLSGLSFQAYDKLQHALHQFMSDTQQILGLNQALALNKLVDTIKNMSE